MASTPSHADPKGSYELDEVLETIQNQWGSGRQIVPLLGAGISVESGVPAINPLTEHLLALRVLQKNSFWWKGNDTKVPAYSLERDEWISPSRLPEHLYPQGKREELVSAFLRNQLWRLEDFPEIMNAAAGAINKGVKSQAIDFARTLGLDWLNLMEEIADHRPELVDIVFDALGAGTVPNATHNLLTHCVHWFNIRLILTTNFDNLVERSLSAEGSPAYSYDIHMQAPPPPKLLIERHLSVIKLHGSHYGLRADHSVDQPLDRGHLATLLDYFDHDVILLCLGYGGGEKRITGFIEALLRKKQQARIIRIDPMAPGEQGFFYGLANSPKYRFKEGTQQGKQRVTNLYYPPSAGLFLLQLYQYAANRLPNTRGRYPSTPHTAAPHKNRPTLGRGVVEPATKGDDTNAGPEVGPVIERLAKGQQSWVLISATGNAGTSQALAKIYESLFPSHQILWCNLDEATSVGTILGWLQDFAYSRQPELPVTPLPLPLPAFTAKAEVSPEEVNHIDRAVRILWSRLERGKFVVILDSLSNALEYLESRSGERNKGEALRLLILVAILIKYATKSTGRCLLIVGTHRSLADLANLRKRAEAILPRKALSELMEIGGAELHHHVQDLISIRQTDNNKIDVGSKDPISLSNAEKLDIKPWLATNFPEDVNSYIAKKPDICISESDFDGYFAKFIVGSALCNRPRSWRQLIQLPAVKEMGQHYASLENVDKRSHALAFLVNRALRSKLLYLQPGGFFYMDGVARQLLRDSTAILGDGGKTTHQRMAEFFRRTYNQSGDVTALNHYFYHRIQWLELLSNDTEEYVSVLESTINHILENALPARGCLYAYDHCFLLLQLLELLDGSQLKFQLGEGEIEWQQLQLQGKTGTALEEAGKLLSSYKKFVSFRRRVLVALCEVYEENGDAKNGEQAAERLIGDSLLLKRLREAGRSSSSGSNDLRGVDDIDLARAYHRMQKAKWQQVKASQSCFYALNALNLLLNSRETSLERDAEFPKILNEIYKILELEEQIAIFEGHLESAAKEKEISTAVKSIQTKYSKISPAPHRILVHRVILRLVRTLIRVSAYGDCAFDGSPTQPEERKKIYCLSVNLCDIFAEFGADINAGNEASSATKLLEARYFASRGLRSLYQLGESSGEAMNLKMTFFNHQAQSDTMRANGSLTSTYEANTLIDEAEMLLWKARTTLRRQITRGGAVTLQAKEEAYADAAARQEATLRHFDIARTLLVSGSISLASWREMTVLRAAATADILKRFTSYNLDLDEEDTRIKNGIDALDPHNGDDVLKIADLEDQKANVKTKRHLLFADFAYHAEQAAFELGHLLPLLWNDFWRGSRASVQLLRIAGYIARMVSVMITDLDASTEATETAPPVVVSLNTLTRAVNNFDLGSGNKIPSVPLKKSTSQEKFINDLWFGLSCWVNRIDTWANRILPEDLSGSPHEESWREIPQAYFLFKARQTHCKDGSLCSQEFEAIHQAKDDTSKKKSAIEALIRAFSDPMKRSEWTTQVRHWSNTYRHRP